jgi:hypothetical protein
LTGATDDGTLSSIKTLQQEKVSEVKFLLLSLVVLSVILGVIPQGHAMGERSVSNLSSKDTFVLDAFKKYPEMKARASHIVELCNQDLDCVDKIIRRDNPDIDVKDIGKQLIEQSYILHRTTLGGIEYNYVFGVTAYRNNRKIFQYDVNQGSVLP